MRTDDLIHALAEDAKPGTPPGKRLAVLLPLAAIVSLGGLIATIGLRADVVQALFSAPVLRQGLAVALLLAGLLAALRLAHPEGRALLWPIGVPVLAGVGLVIWALWSTPADGWGMALQGKTQMACLVSIPLLSVLPVAAILAALREGASPRPALSGALAGLAGGGLGAAIYALHCIEDSPLFWVTWYGTAILIVTVASTLIGGRILRW